MVEKKTDIASNKQQEEDECIREAIANPDAFRPLYEAYFKKIYLFVMHRVGDKDIAGDLTQQVFLSALTHIGRYQFRGFPFSAWLFRIAINQCNNFFRKKKLNRTVVLEDASVEHLYAEITADQTLEEWERQLPAILEKLEQDELYVIELRFFEARPFKEIADILGITENYAKVRTYRILEKMKKLFFKKT
ncbi:MAG: sigma-70 family RNA polymerase sigma factor [Bacteroidia bacterium]|nr:sigma-70 family RNA polymerase sigma factor [Bacteroidia bacterium]